MTNTKKIHTVNVLIVFVLLLIVGLGCAKKEDKEEPQQNFESKTIEIEVGKWITVQISQRNRFYLKYNGMNSGETFSLSESSYSAVNVYYPISVEEFNWYPNMNYCARFQIGLVTPEKIILTCISYDKVK